MERDHANPSERANLFDFNSHAHVERDVICGIGFQYSFYFNSHAHVERDACRLSRLYNMVISTHTLTWSVTHIVGIYALPYYNFNSHAHVERDFIEYLSFLIY